MMLSEAFPPWIVITPMSPSIVKLPASLLDSQAPSSFPWKTLHSTSLHMYSSVFDQKHERSPFQIYETSYLWSSLLSGVLTIFSENLNFIFFSSLTRLLLPIILHFFVLWFEYWLQAKCLVNMKFRLYISFISRVVFLYWDAWEVILCNWLCSLNIEPKRKESRKVMF